MEKKTNKEKFEIFKFLRKSVLIGKAIAYDKIGGNYALSANLQKYAYWDNLHAEFIYAMKTVQNPTIFMKNAKKKMNNFVNFC